MTADLVMKSADPDTSTESNRLSSEPSISTSKIHTEPSKDPPRAIARRLRSFSNTDFDLRSSEFTWNIDPNSVSNKESTEYVLSRTFRRCNFIWQLRLESKGLDEPPELSIELLSSIKSSMRAHFTYTTVLGCKTVTRATKICKLSKSKFIEGRQRCQLGILMGNFDFIKFRFGIQHLKPVKNSNNSTEHDSHTPFGGLTSPKKANRQSLGNVSLHIDSPKSINNQSLEPSSVNALKRPYDTMSSFVASPKSSKVQFLERLNVTPLNCTEKQQSKPPIKHHDKIPKTEIISPCKPVITSVKNAGSLAHNAKMPTSTLISTQGKPLNNQTCTMKTSTSTTVKTREVSLNNRVGSVRESASPIVKTQDALLNDQTKKATEPVPQLMNSASPSLGFDQLEVRIDVMKELLRDGNHSDVSIYTSSGKKFQAHKAILSMRSKEFHEMLKSGQGPLKDEIKLGNLSDALVENMLEYIYIGKVSQFNNVVELYKVAKKFGLHGLTKLCLESFREKLEVSNASDILILSDEDNLIDLKERVINFINENIRDVLVTKSFQIMKQTNPSLVVELYCSLGEKK
ncbi:hypothetical protein QAD02_019526 [Eretmocerus hayati]|uniref:Uncharacterized protein n=1 Tax=Eretmocerus hayati TaxID=131215 RepID=A0ACC2PMC2_9HYME|nr:hypothetical protein QAD02_019526 [Eretmocerus hayati]